MKRRVEDRTPLSFTLRTALSELRLTASNECLLNGVSRLSAANVRC